MKCSLTLLDVRGVGGSVCPSGCMGSGLEQRFQNERLPCSEPVRAAVRVAAWLSERQECVECVSGCVAE